MYYVAPMQRFLFVQLWSFLQGLHWVAPECLLSALKMEMLWDRFQWWNDWGRWYKPVMKY